MFRSVLCIEFFFFNSHQKKLFREQLLPSVLT
jgi:hypothetical protein